MDLRQLEYFVAVADEQHFTRAASRLHVVQSGLSASIKALEDQLGAPLFFRTTRRVTLTPVGKAFLTEARRVLAAAEDARQLVAEMQGLRRGRLSIGCIHGLAPLLNLPELLGRFHAAYPEIEIRLISGGTGPLIEGVRDGELDLAFTQFVGTTPPEVSAWMLCCEPLVAACRPDHWLAGRRDVTLQQLVNETFVELNPEWGTRQLVDRSFRDVQVTRHIGFEVNNFLAQLDLVAHGLGVALMPAAVVLQRTVTNELPVAYAELVEPEPCWELAAVFAHDGDGQPVSSVARMILDLLRPNLPAEFEVPAFSV